MIFSENRCTLFGIMLRAPTDAVVSAAISDSMEGATDGA
jgi:hypothetical protein